MKKTTLNYIIGIDTFDCNVKLMRVQGNDLSGAHVEYLPFEQEMLIKSDFSAILNDTLAKYFENIIIDQSMSVYLILPNSVIGSDLFIVPTLKQAKMTEALHTQMKNLYPFINDYKFNIMTLSSNKVNTTYQVFMASKQVMSAMYTALALNKMVVKNSTYAAASALNAVLQFNPKLSKRNFIFMDVKQNVTDYIVCNSGITTGFSSITLGHKILLADKVLRESTLYNNDLAELAVINANERAKRKKMTETIMDEDYEDNLIEQQAIVVNELQQGATDDEEIMRQAQEALESQDDTDDVDTEIDEEEIERLLQIKRLEEEQRAKAEARKILMRKAPKKLPKFMQRPVPETQQGITAENFRIFAKKALLMALYNNDNAILTNPEFVLVNMPKEFAYTIEEINKEEDNGIEFKYLDLSEYRNAHLTDNLDLIGALSTKNLNKYGNF